MVTVCTTHALVYLSERVDTKLIPAGALVSGSDGCLHRLQQSCPGREGEATGAGREI